ncbi:MAG TPA: glycosyltransferase family 39 protein [Pyrinomonadaceae bacterium]|nr:glycosyltransferase family 39 protein [Pyrinomonadaceae bacterium]
MNALLAVLALALSIGIAFLLPGVGGGAVIVCALVAVVAGTIISQVRLDREFLLQIFVGALLIRMAVGTAIYYLNLQEFFGGDALTYDQLGYLLMKVWTGELSPVTFKTQIGPFLARNWGMIYVVAGIYSALGRNMLAVQFFNAVLGAATAPIIYLCARHIFQNSRVARIATFSVAFYPSLVLWSSQGLKDGPIVFLLALVMLATLKLGERFDAKFLVILVGAFFSIMTLRFYIFYMTAAAVAGAFIVGMRPLTSTSLFRQILLIISLGLALTYLGVLRTAGTQLEYYGDLERLQISRNDLTRAQSGFGSDVDVSTTEGALKVIPVGMTYLLFAPFPWQLGSLRQSITLPEMIVWWASFPLLVIGVWFTLKYRLRQSLPILIFTAMLTLAYSIFQGNVGTAYRQRSQLLVFYFIFVAVGFVLMRERREDQKQLAQQAKQVALDGYRAPQAAYRASQKAVNT